MTGPLDLETIDLWSTMIAAFISDSAALRDAFIERWRLNAVSSAPTGLPSSNGIADVYGWSSALEGYLLSFDQPSSETRAIAQAVNEACAKFQGHFGDAWLADVLALRRLPAVHQEHGDFDQWSESNCEIAEFILGQVGRISETFPRPDTEAYTFFRRRYEMLTVALVSEVIEGVCANDVQLSVMSGSRFIEPGARSIFRVIAAMANERKLSPLVLERARGNLQLWASEIGKLVDTISDLNEGLELLGRVNAGWASRSAPQLVDEHREAWSRMFDRSFRILLAADSRHRKGHDPVRTVQLQKALDILAAKSAANLFGPVRPSIDLTTVQGVLWQGYNPKPGIDFGDDGQIYVGGGLEERWANEERSLADADEDGLFR